MKIEEKDTTIKAETITEAITYLKTQHGYISTEPSNRKERQRAFYTGALLMFEFLLTNYYADGWSYKDFSNLKKDIEGGAER